MENRKATEAGQGVTMQKEDFAALWKTIHVQGGAFPVEADGLYDVLAVSQDGLLHLCTYHIYLQYIRRNSVKEFRVLHNLHK